MEELLRYPRQLGKPEDNYWVLWWRCWEFQQGCRARELQRPWHGLSTLLVNAHTVEAILRLMFRFNICWWCLLSWNVSNQYIFHQYYLTGWWFSPLRRRLNDPHVRVRIFYIDNVGNLSSPGCRSLNAMVKPTVRGAMVTNDTIVLTCMIWLDKT